MKTVGLIGGSGLIGSHTTQKFLNEGYNLKVSVTDIKKSEKYQHLFNLENTDNLNISALKVEDLETLKDFISDCEIVVHGGPGGTHEFFENFDGYLPNAEIEYIYYDQLDSYYSDKPNDSTLWATEHFVEEVEQVRKALNLDKDNFYLLGQSWGGILAMEYALKYQDNLKGLIISNMMGSIPEYEKYAEVLGAKLPPEVYKEIKDFEEKEILPIQDMPSWYKTITTQSTFFANLWMNGRNLSIARFHTSTLIFISICRVTANWA